MRVAGKFSAAPAELWEFRMTKEFRMKNDECGGPRARGRSSLASVIRHSSFAIPILLTGLAFAHNPDTSYARCLIADDRVELRLTYDVFTLQWITAVDVNRDGRATREELRQAAPAIQRFLRERVHVEIDGQSAPLGEAADPLWPGETGEGLAAPDWHTAAGLITFPFRQSRAKPPREVALSFDFFETLTARHTVLGAFEHGTRKEEVSFTQAEPDYLFDTTYIQPAAAMPVPVSTPIPSTPSPALPPPVDTRGRLRVWGVAVLLLLPLRWWLRRSGM